MFFTDVSQNTQMCISLRNEWFMHLVPTYLTYVYTIDLNADFTSVTVSLETLAS